MSIKSCKNKYDLVFSIGEACSCTELLRRCQIQFYSYPFDWLYGSNLKNRIDILVNNADNWLNKEDLEKAGQSEKCDIYFNNRTQITFNHDFPIGIDLDESFDKVKEKYNRRFQRLINHIKTSSNVLVVFLQVPNCRNIIESDVLQYSIDELKKRFPHTNFHLLYLYNDRKTAFDKRLVTHPTPEITQIVFDYDGYNEELHYVVDRQKLKKIFKEFYITNKHLKVKNKVINIFYSAYKILNKKISSLKKKENFDHIISLGYNCETAFRILKINKCLESSLFNWTYSETINELIYSLQNLEQICKGKMHGPSPLWRCENTGIHFHGRIPIDKYINKTATQDMIDDDLKELYSRIEYLKHKFEKTALSKESKLYVYKIKEKDLGKNAVQNILSLYKTLETYGALNFKLLVILEKKHLNQKIIEELQINENIIIKTVKQFPPDEAVTSKKYKNNCWKKIFKNFRIKYNTHKKKHYKFEKGRSVDSTK